VTLLAQPVDDSMADAQPQRMDTVEKMNATQQAAPAVFVQCCVFLTVGIWVPIVYGLGIPNVNTDTCEMNLTLWMQVDCVLRYGWPPAILLLKLFTACFECRQSFKGVHVLHSLTIVFGISSAIWGSVILGGITEAACVKDPEDSVNPYILLKAMIIIYWVAFGMIPFCICFAVFYGVKMAQSDPSLQADTIGNSA
jgi:hypothetical protein